MQVGERGTPFVNIWLNSYNDYDPNDWARNSVQMAYHISERCPHLVHIEERSFHPPSGIDFYNLYYTNYNLSSFFTVHLYFKKVYYIPENQVDLDGYNCTAGEAMRTVLYDKPDLRRTYNNTMGYHLKGEKWIKERLNQ